MTVSTFLLARLNASMLPDPWLFNSEALFALLD
jgi:hypothetical protein